MFEAGREWDAHEVWEALWKERRGTEAGQLLRGLIQWAAAGVKWRLGRKSGALFSLSRPWFNPRGRSYETRSNGDIR